MSLTCEYRQDVKKLPLVQLFQNDRSNPEVESLWKEADSADAVVHTIILIRLCA